MVETIDLAIKGLRQSEISRIQEEVKPEIAWWKDNMIVDQEAAIKSGALITVPPEGMGYRLIGVLRRDEEPRTLNPQAYRLLGVISQRWIDFLEEADLELRDAFISVTSLFRGPELQKKFVDFGENAAKVSAHQAGAAIDFDPAGYFIGESRNAMNAKRDGYHPMYLSALAYVLADLENQGVCHLIVERSFEPNEGKTVSRVSCYHVCVSPNFVKP